MHYLFLSMENRWVFYIRSYWASRRKAVWLKGTISKSQSLNANLVYTHIIGQTSGKYHVLPIHAASKEVKSKINPPVAAKKKKEGTNRPELIVIAVDIDPVLTKWLCQGEIQQQVRFSLYPSTPPCRLLHCPSRSNKK